MVFSEAGWNVTIATPGGRVPAVDANSLLPEYTGADGATIAQLKRYLAELAPELENPVALESIDPSDFDVLFLPGGHGPMQDLAVSPRMGAVIVQMLDAGSVVASVCHASAALLSADRTDGSWAFEGYRLTGFTNAEEEAVGLAPKAAWLLEDRLRERGAQFRAGEMWVPYLVSDRNLYTGQNPASSAPLAEQIVAAVSTAVA
jgi:putative intracellular protease/amidase